MFSINAVRRLKVSCEIALNQLNCYLETQALDGRRYTEAFKARETRFKQWHDSLQSLEMPSDSNIVTVPHLTSRLRQHLPEDTTFVLEAVTNAGPIIHHLNLVKVTILQQLLVYIRY